MGPNTILAQEQRDEFSPTQRFASARQEHLLAKVCCLKAGEERLLLCHLFCSVSVRHWFLKEVGAIVCINDNKQWEYRGGLTAILEKLSQTKALLGEFLWGPALESSGQPLN